MCVCLFAATKNGREPREKDHYDEHKSRESTKIKTPYMSACKAPEFFFSKFPTVDFRFDGDCSALMVIAVASNSRGDCPAPW
jgi:hypothetical protein